MDIELLSKMIAELVPDHPEVGLPGLGTFVSEFVPASFTDRGYTITPPYKRVTFVPGAVTNNSLVELYARSNGLSEDQARAALSQFLEDTKKVLLDRKTVVFPGLGRLRATRQNNIFFITDEALDIYPEGFGLEPVSLKNHEETPAEVHHVVESLAGIMVAPTEEFVEPAGAANEPAAAVEPAVDAAAEARAEYQPIFPSDERLEFADEPAKAADEPVPGEGAKPECEEGRNQNGAKMLHPPGKNEGGVSKKAKNAAAKAAKAQSKADAKAAKVQARADRKAAKAQAKTDAKAAKAEAKAAAKAARAEAREAKAQARAARRASRKPVPKWIWVTPLVILAILAIAAGVFYILVYAAPDFLDTLLYTPEELRIINW